MADIFSEVEEELRRDKYNALLRRHGPWILAVVTLIVIAAGLHQLVWEPYREGRVHRISDTYAEATALRAAGRMEEANAAFAELAAGDHAGYATLALLQQAELAETAGDSARASALYSQAADRARGDSLAGLARLRALYAVVDTASYAEILARAEPLATADSPYRSSAREIIGAAALRAGDVNRALREYQFLILAPETPDGIRERAAEGLAAAERAAAESVPAERADGDEAGMAEDTP